MRQRLGLARALLGRPKLLVLDEPTNGLDPDGIREMRELIRALPEREGVTVFVSSHLLGEVEQIAGHVGLMHEGRLLAQSPLAELKARGSPEAEIGVSDAAGAALLLHGLGVQARVSGTDRVGFAPPPGGPRALADLNRRLVQEGFEVFALSAREPSLEDIFLQMVSARSAPQAPRAARAA
jgi:ABC-2 type transport system ATP-binding protein